MNDVLDAITERTALLVDALSKTDLESASALPDWSRLTIACHLRYGAQAMRWMTEDAIAGRRTAYYPEGRDRQRPGTLVPLPGESPSDVVASLRAASAVLDRTWSAVSDWDVMVIEPDDNPDLGPNPLRNIPLFRLTEIEVHGTDLDLGLPPWSDTLVHAALPMRLERMTRRRALRPGAWRLVATDGPWDGLETVLGDGTEAEVIATTSRQLFAMTLGRSSISQTFNRAFPGP